MGDIPEVTQEQNELAALVPEGPVKELGAVKNWAEDQKVRERVEKELIPLVKNIRDRRKPLTDWWAKLFRVWSLEHEEQGYSGRSNIYVPAGKKALETLVSQLVAGTFPGDDNFGVDPENPNFATMAEDVKAMLKHDIDKVSKVRVGIDRYYRQLVTTGNSPVKIYYDKRYVTGKSRKNKNPLYGSYAMPEETEFCVYDGPVFDTVDCSNVYLWPEDINDPSNCDIVFEDLTVSMARLRHQARKGIYVMSEVEKLENETRSDQKSANTENRLSGQGITSPHNVKNSDGWGLADITEVWLDFDPEAVSKGEEENPIPCLVTISTMGGAVLRVRTNPFWHKRHPYLWGRMGITVGRVYGTGFAESIRELNVLLNDQTNQAMDCGTYALNPIVLTDPNQIQGALGDLEPGVQWLVNDINRAVKFERPPTDLIQAGSVMTAQTQAWINDFSGAPPVLQGGSAPGRAFRTATGVGTAQQNAVVPLNEIIKLSEKEVFEPMLFMFFSLRQQFAEDSVMVQLTGRSMKRVDPRMLHGNYLFSWTATDQTSNKQMKGAQITQLLQVLMPPPMQMMLQANGLKFNPAPLVKKLYTEVMGFRDVDNVLVPLQPGEMVPQGKGVEGPAAPGSTTAMNGSIEELNGNGEFAANRIGANDISSVLGAMFGGANNGEMPPEA